MKKSKISNESKLQQSPGGLLSPSPGASSIEERKSENFPVKCGSTGSTDMILLRPPEPHDPINMSEGENAEDDNASPAVRLTYSPTGDEWRYTSSLSKPSDAIPDDRPDEIGRFMQKFDSVEHAKELHHALQAIAEADSAVEDTLRIESHNVSKKTKGIKQIEKKQQPRAELKQAYADIDKFLSEHERENSHGHKE